MGAWGNADIKKLKKFKNKVDKLANSDMDKLCEDCSKNIVSRLKASAKRLTPVDTGTLRNEWFNTPVYKLGDIYESEVYNSMSYAMYVEYGHRTRNGGFVEGKYMMTKSIRNLEPNIPKIINIKVGEYLRGLDGK